MNGILLQLKCSITLLSSPKFEYCYVPAGEDLVYDGRFVGWKELVKMLIYSFLWIIAKKIQKRTFFTFERVGSPRSVLF